MVQASGFGWLAPDGACWWEMGRLLATSAIVASFNAYLKVLTGLLINSVPFLMKSSLY